MNGVHVPFILNISFMKFFITTLRVLSIPVFCLLVTPIYAFTDANALLSGKIIDNKTGMPLSGAVIYLHEAKTGTVSDSLGNYKTPSVPAGRYLVEISFEGYTSILESIDITNNPVRNFSLKETYAENEEVTVTGVASATKAKQSAQPVSILRRSDLLHTASTNVIDAVAKMVPGVSNLSSGPAVSKPVIRGLGYNRVVTVNDGVRQEGQQWGDEHGIEIDEYSIQKIEILKGPASLLYGSDAMAGVIHLITNVPVEQGTLKGNILGTFIDNNGLYGGSANLAGHLRNGFNWNLYGSSKSAADYRNKYDGKVFNSRFYEKNFGGYIGLNQSWGYSHLLFSHFNQKLGMVEGVRDPATGQFLVYAETPYEHIATADELDSRSPFNPKQHISHFKMALDNNFSIGADRLALNIGYQRNQRRELGNPDAPNTPDLYFDLKTINYSTQYNLADRNGWKTSAGITGMYQQNRNLAEEVLIPEYNQVDIGGFLYTKKTFNNNLTLSGGLRVDYRTLNSKAYEDAGVPKFTAFTKSFGNVSGSAGLSYNASDAVTLKFNMARGYRAPNASELASNGAHEGADRYEYGDQNLKTETSLQLDGGIEVNNQHISLQLNAFYNHINNYIFYGKLESAAGGDSLVDVGGEQLTAFTFRQSAAMLSGFEIKFDLHPHPLDWLHFENSFSFVAGQFEHAIDGSRRLPFIPAPKLQSELRGDFNKAGKGLKNLYAKIEMDNVSTQNRIFTGYNTETVTDGYTLFNVGAGTDVTNRKGKVLFGIHIALNNIADVAYQNHLSRLKYTDMNNATGRTGVFNMGRNFSLKLNVPFDWRLN
jgi:iron complex outermembrane receptor protein